MSEAIQTQETTPVPENNVQPQTNEAQKPPETKVETPQQQTTEPPKEATQEMKDAAKSTLRKLNIKVDGKEIEKEIDTANEEELIKLVQLAEMSQKRAQRAAELEKKEAKVQKDLQEFFNYLQSDTANALRKMGIDIDSLSEKIINEKLEKAQMDPKDRELMELQEKLKLKEKEEQDAKKRAEEIEMQMLKDKYAEEYQRDLMNAIEKNELPMNPEIINRMTGYMRIALKNNIDVSFNDIVPLVKEQILSEIQAIASVMPLEAIEKLLGDEKLGEMVKRRKKAEPVKKEAPPTANSIKDTGTKPTKEVADRKLKTIDPKKFWGSI